MHTHVYICVHTCHDAYVEVRGQLEGLGFFLLPCGSHGSKSRFQEGPRCLLSWKSHLANPIYCVFNGQTSSLKASSNSWSTLPSVVTWLFNELLLLCVDFSLCQKLFFHFYSPAWLLLLFLPLPIVKFLLMKMEFPNFDKDQKK